MLTLQARDGARGRRADAAAAPRRSEFTEEEWRLVSELADHPQSACW